MSNFNPNSDHNTSPKLTIPLIGNIIPHSWYGEIVSDSGNTDFNAITILSEIVYWYRPSKDGTSKFHGSAWQTSYSHFEQKFGFNKQRIRRALVKLEQLGIIKRELKTIYLYGQKYNNVLFIHLLEKSTYCSISTKNNPEKNSNISFADNSNSIESNYSDNLDMLSESNEEKYHFETDALEPLDLESIEKNSFFLPLYNFDSPSLQFCRDYIKEEKNNLKDYKNRSMRSNFGKEDFSNISLNDGAMKIGKGIGEEISKYNNHDHLDPKLTLAEKKLLDFHPLETKDCAELRLLCSRDFSDNAINEILKDVSRKKPEWSCKSKKGFMSYMSEILRFEKRNAILISGQGFRINNNLTKEEQDNKQREKFLSEIEDSLDRSLEMQLKKKISARLSPESAYRFLRSYISGDRVGENFKISLKEAIGLSVLEKQIILEEVKSIYDSCTLEEFIYIKSLEFETKEVSKDINHAKLDNLTIEDLRSCSESSIGIWGAIRKKLIRYFGSEGISLDEVWFSKLEAIIDEDGSGVILRAPSKFIKEWINNKYGCLISNICKSENLTLREIMV